MVVAVGEGTGAGWMLAGLVISGVTMILQILVGLGKYPPHWPLQAASTKSGQIAAIALYGAFVVFCTVGLILAL